MNAVGSVLQHCLFEAFSCNTAVNYGSKGEKKSIFYIMYIHLYRSCLAETSS